MSASKIAFPTPNLVTNSHQRMDAASEGSFNDIHSQLLANPAFDTAARELASAMLAVSAEHPALDKVFKDAGKYVAAMCATALHDEGLTLVGLKALCARFGLLSAGRVRALLLYMRYLGFVSMRSDRSAGDPVRYIVSAPFLSLWRIHLKAALTAASILDPDAEAAANRLDDADFFSRFCRLHAEGLAETMGYEPPDFAILKVFINRNAGAQISWTLLFQGKVEFPPTGPVYLQRAALARRFGVSRVHIRRIIQDACDEDLLKPIDDGRFQFTERARQQFRFLYGAQLTQLTMTSRRALEMSRGAATQIASGR